MRTAEFNPRYLLLLEASVRQRRDAGLLPAWERYDGPMFRDLRTWRNAGRILPNILILSPLHGLLDPNDEIEAYDAVVLEDDVASIIADDEDNHALFRDRFAQAQRTVCVTSRRGNLIFRQWLEAGEHYQYEANGLSRKREVMRHFLEEVPQNVMAPIVPPAVQTVVPPAAQAALKAPAKVSPKPSPKATVKPPIKSPAKAPAKPPATPPGRTPGSKPRRAHVA